MNILGLVKDTRYKSKLQKIITDTKICLRTQNVGEIECWTLRILQSSLVELKLVS